MHCTTVLRSYMGAEMCTVVMHTVNTLTLSTESSTNVLSFYSHSTQGHAVKLYCLSFIFLIIVYIRQIQTECTSLKPGLPSQWTLRANGPSSKVHWNDGSTRMRHCMASSLLTTFVLHASTQCYCQLNNMWFKQVVQLCNCTLNAFQSSQTMYQPNYN